MRQSPRLTQFLLAAIALLLAANLVTSLQRPLIARAGGRAAEERMADALERIASNGLKARATGEYGYGPVEVKVKN